MKWTRPAFLFLLIFSFWTRAQGPGVPPARAQQPPNPPTEATPPVDVLAVDHRDWQASGTHGAVAAGGRGAAAAGLEILKAGGNAADAAAATLLALAVTDSTQFCFGGEVPILIYDAKTRNVAAINGQGAAPRLATREHFAARGDVAIPSHGIEAATVPAAFDACVTLLDRFGTMTLAQVSQPALRLLARNSEPWHKDLAATLGTLLQAEARAHHHDPSRPADRARGLRLAADAFY